MSHFFKHLIHSIKHLFTGAQQTANRVLSDPRTGNIINLTSLGLKAVNESSGSAPSSSQANPAPESDISGEEAEFINNFKQLIENLTEKANELETQIASLNSENTLLRNNISELQTDLSNLKNQQSELEIRATGIENKFAASQEYFLKFEKQQNLMTYSLIGSTIVIGFVLWAMYLKLI